ncbi:MAG: SDR family NAD(P)-dependent oxidoreductase [Boseongicola sp.]|nr:SDR family NAD(P)-dependent oxidoreductase [Boseongicola sp.]MYH58999.1 SDR family NAD(P)-dependent oxidoreductase [Boseongicola sp. SB0675_bin_26]
MSDRKPLSNKAAVVTGAGRGIGRAIAIGFAKAGADVAILARTESELSQVAEAVTGHGVRCHVGPVDLSDPEATEKACADVVAGLGDVDILVNNAGVDLELGQVADSDPERWWRAIEINVRGTYLVTRFLLEHINEGGKIINKSSGMGLRAAAQQSSYTVSKAGVHIFTECLANELWPRKIDVNNVIPGPVATDIFNREGRPERYTPEEVLEKFKDELPPGFPPQERIKHPDEVAGLAVFIASQPVGGSTGQTYSLARRPF